VGKFSERGQIKMLLNVYLCGWLVTTIGALVAANRLSDRRRSRPLSVGLLAVLGRCAVAGARGWCGGTHCHRGCGQGDESR
jgi:hypothetical protein